MHPSTTTATVTVCCFFFVVVVHLSAASPAQGGVVAVAGCKRQDRIYRLGDTWQEDDGCVSCTCDLGGQARCQSFMCQVACDNPRRVQGECCPACDGLSVVTQFQSCPSLGNCTLKCTHGFVVDDGGCYSCQCQQGAACTLDCPAGYARDAAGNELCECSCPAMQTCSKRCTHGYRKDADGCSTCTCLPAAESTLVGTEDKMEHQSCAEAAGQVRDDGEYWFDGCRGCYCSAGRTLCELASCRDDPRALRRMAELALCSDNAVIVAGCVACRCLHERALCEVAACPPAACENPLPPDTMGCCPTCPDGPDGWSSSAASPASCAGGQPHGSSWRVSDCTSCRCRDGQAECFEQRCPALQCSLHFTPRGMCCPLCLDERSLAGSSAVPAPSPGVLTGLGPGGPGGATPPQQQAAPGLAPPGAAGAAGACHWRNESHAAASEWFPDECTHCSCDPAGSGSSSCTQTVCPSCSTTPSRCCPTCPDGAALVSLLVPLLGVTALLLVLAVGVFAWQRGRRQTLDIARARASARPARPAPTYTYNMIPAEKAVAVQ